MVLLFVASTGDHAGQSLVTWALARRFAEKGLRVGFFKPFVTERVQIDGAWTDRDAVLFRQAMGLADPLDRIAPFPSEVEMGREQTPERIMEGLRALVQELSLGKDALIIMGFRDIFYDDASRLVPDTALINGLDAHLVLVTRYQETSTSVYSILSVCSLLRERVKAVIVNRVPPEQLQTVKGQLGAVLTQRTIPVSAVLPEDFLLSCRSLGEVLEVVEGELLWGEEGLGRPVGAMTVGSADLDQELLVFKRVYNKIVLLGPPSPAAFPQDGPARRPIAGILLTSGRRPPSMLMEVARKAGVALALANADTFAVLDRLERTPPSLSPGDEAKVRRMTELLDQEEALHKLLLALGVRVP